MERTLTVGARVGVEDLCVVLRAAVGGGLRPRTKSELVGLAVHALAELLAEEDAGLRPASLEEALAELEQAFANLRGAQGSFLRRRNDSSVRRALLASQEGVFDATGGGGGADPELVREVMERLTAPEAFDALAAASGGEASGGEAAEDDEVIDPQRLEQLLRRQGGGPSGGPSGDE